MILHIVLFILKTVGILLLAVLALLLCLALFLLISPIVYRFNVSGEGTREKIRAEAQFHWLMHLMSGSVKYENGTLLWNLRIAWKKTDNRRESEEGKSGSTEKGRRPAGTEKKSDEMPQTQQIEKSDEMPQAQKEKTDEVSRVQNETSAEIHEKKKVFLEKNPARNEYRGNGRKRRFVRNQKKKKSRKISEIIKRFREKIKYTFQRICDTIKMLQGKKEKVLAFVKNEIHQKAFFYILKQSKTILFWYRPKEWILNIKFGFSDPSYTGYALAGISLLWPLAAESVQIEPDFEREIFCGTARVRGKIRLFYAAAALLKTILNKNVRITFKHIRNFKL